MEARMTLLQCDTGQPASLRFSKRTYELKEEGETWTVRQLTVGIDGPTRIERIASDNSLKEALFKTEQFVADDIYSLFAH
jgi:hypothetical protein